MLIEQQVSVKWGTINKKHYIDLGYEFTNYGDEFYVSVFHLTKKSKVKVNYICDYCNKEKQKNFCTLSSIQNNEKDCCSKCNVKKRVENKINNGKSLGHLFPYSILEWSTKNEKTPFDYAPVSGEKVWWICENGHEWEATIAGRTNKGRGCSECNNGGSKGENKIKEILEKNDIKFKKQYSFCDLLNENNKKLLFDFAIFKDKLCLVEYDGMQHYQPIFGEEEHFKTTQYRDGLKNKYCKEHNIKLIRIKYTEYYNIEEILKMHNII